MYSDTELESAVTAGIVSAETAAAFRAHVATYRRAPLADEEQVRLLTGFNDIFVSITAGLLLGALALLGGGMASDSLALLYGGGLVASASWLLAEYFTRRRHMALPSILLLLGFVGGLFSAGAGATHLVSPAPNGDLGLPAVAMGGLAAAIGAYAHWRRFMVPITIAAGAVATLGLAIAGVASLFPGLRSHDAFLAALFASGLLVFALAMRWDMSDPERRTRRTDVAFWLHLAAAPMIVHPAFQWLGVLESGATALSAVTGLALYAALTISALLVDRRALMVSALAYVLAAMTTLFREAGALSLSTALTALALGSALLLLSAFWHGVRVQLVRLLPLAVSRLLPPAAQRSVAQA